MTSRKKKIRLIQVIIFLVASFLLFSTYRDTNEKIIETAKSEVVMDDTNNSFSDIQYSGFDLNGNRYTLQAGTANFKTEEPESINMKNVVANFYLKDNTVLKVVSDEGLYNNITLDMNFRKNVKSTYSANTLLSNQLTYSNTEGKLIVTGNVRGESVEKGEFFADNVEYDLTSKILDLSMFDKKQVQINVKN
ncbi:hypothetical protein OAM15_01285 [Pelagibacteraceae bacterium]|nr:hypothetical protein [Pelagibacteraceae bacterium]